EAAISTMKEGKYSFQRRVTVAATSAAHDSSAGKPGFSRASMRMGAMNDTWLRDSRRSAAWMSAAGSKRVNVVHKKFIALRAARRGVSVRTRRGQLANDG